MRNSNWLSVTGFPALLAAFWFTGNYFGITARLGEHPVAMVLSFAILLAPYWFFGFGLAVPLRRALNSPQKRFAGAAMLILPYLVFSVWRGEFRTVFCLELFAALLGLTLLLEFVRAPWADYTALLAIALIIEKHVFDSAWPIPGLNGLTKLLFVDAVLYNYLVVRPDIAMGFDFRARLRDFVTGLREFVFYIPVALGLGFALGFLHLHRIAGNPAWFAAGWLFTLFFVAIPEEIFFRGLLLNLLERDFGGKVKPLLISAILFGLAHFNKRAVFNWRYVILAAIGGIFYGRSYLADRRILSAGITHATVDTVWSIWLR